jgi:hypothetical protein
MSTRVAVEWNDLLLAFDFANAGAPLAEACIFLRTGKTHWVSPDLDPEQQDVPADINDPDLFLPLQDKSVLGLGRDLALAFAGSNRS